MLQNYLKIAWRSLLRNRTNAFINIAGLALGMASFIMIVLYVQDELKFDRFLNNPERIHQVTLNANFDGQEFHTGKTPASVSSALLRNFPEIENAARVYRPGEMIVRSELVGHKATVFTEAGLLAVDSTFLDIFSFGMRTGDRATCLQQPNSIVITERTAMKYFGTMDALGKTLYLGKDNKPFAITAVLNDLPSQSTMQFDMLTPVAAFPVVKRMSWSWVWLQVCTYVKLKSTVSVSPETLQKLEAKFPLMVQTEAASAFKRVGQPLEELKKKGGKWELHLQPYTAIHLHSAGIGQVFDNVSDIKYVHMFSAIALFIILLACVNFMNLSTARSSRRAKEVGVRKVLGSERKQLIRQFLTEALLFSFVSAIIALGIAALFLGPFNSLSGKSLSAAQLFSAGNLLLVTGLAGLTGLLAGGYPAFYLSSFNPAVVIKGALQTAGGFRDLMVRNGLVVFQFTVSTALIICTIVVFRQLQFMQSKDLGLNKENVLIIRNSDRLGSRQEAFRNGLLGLPEIKNASIASGVPTRENFGDSYIPESSSAGERLVPDLLLSSFIVDENFIPTHGITVLQGRNFSKDFNDSAAVILNETAAKEMGWKQPLGSYITYPGNNNQRFKVIAVVKDFNTSSLHSPVAPFALFYQSSKTYDLGASYIVLRSRPGTTGHIVSALEQKWKALAPSAPLDVSFLDDEFEALYKAEKRMGSVFFIFTGLSILVACMGLFGLAIYSAERRTKEIGIRKVLGAPVAGIMALMSRDFIKLVVTAAVIACPLAWWWMNKWLENFAYKTTVGWWVFALAAFISVSITLLTVSWQTVRAALANPVKSLRSE